LGPTSNGSIRLCNIPASPNSGCIRQRPSCISKMVASPQFRAVGSSTGTRRSARRGMRCSGRRGSRSRRQRRANCARSHPVCARTPTLRRSSHYLVRSGPSRRKLMSAIHRAPRVANRRPGLLASGMSRPAGSWRLTMPDESLLRADAREVVRTGKMPSRRRDRPWGGPGVGGDNVMARPRPEKKREPRAAAGTKRAPRRSTSPPVGRYEIGTPSSASA
jgi:hypothetical protein